MSQSRSRTEAERTGSRVKRKTAKDGAFSKLKAALEGAIANRRGAHQLLTERAIETKPRRAGLA
jgi:hypothetical protein